MDVVNVGDIDAGKHNGNNGGDGDSNGSSDGEDSDGMAHGEDSEYWPQSAMDFFGFSEAGGGQSCQVKRPQAEPPHPEWVSATNFQLTDEIFGLVDKPRLEPGAKHQGAASSTIE